MCVRVVRARKLWEYGDTHVLEANLHADEKRCFAVCLLGVGTPEIRFPAMEVKARAMAAMRFAESRLLPGGTAIPMKLRLEGRHDVCGRELSSVLPWWWLRWGRTPSL
jgi:hypothetical protein